MYVDLSLHLQDKPNLVAVDDLFSISNLVIKIIAFLFITDISLQFFFDVALSWFCIRNLLKTFGRITVLLFSFSFFLSFLSFLLSSFLLLIRYSENSNGYKESEVLEGRKG